MDLKTVSELSEMFGVTRQAMNNRVKKLPEQYVEKNEKGTTVVNVNGIHELEKIYDKKVIPDSSEIEGLESDPKGMTALISSLLEDKNAEIRRLNEQLRVKDSQLSSKDSQIAVKDQQISEKDKQLDQQQQLTAKAMADSEQLRLDFTEEQNRGFFARLFNKKPKSVEAENKDKNI